MKEPDVSEWSREELETAYKQMAKNCSARGQRLTYAKTKIEELEKQIAGMDKDEAGQTIAEQAERIEALGKELDDERATRKRAAQYAEELEAEIKALREQKQEPEIRYVNNPTTTIQIDGPRPSMMTICFDREDEK
jgi:septal ring factor EnvC (AmiA/AmiB activator)